MGDEHPSAKQLTDFVERIRAERKYWSRQQFDPPPEPPEQPKPDHYRLRFRPGYAAYQPAVSLDQARAQISSKIWDYTLEKRPNRYLLIRAQPGVGKTHIGVDITQRFAELSSRVLYAMPMHKHFETLSELPHFQSQHWYHWLATDAESPDTGNKMCLYSQQMMLWTQKGYPAMKLCNSLCAMYKSNCEFRRQALRPERVIAGVHNHVSLGLQISDFDLVFIDELPLSAFMRPRHIPDEGLRLATVGPVADLSQELAAICREEKTLKGRELLERIGPLLDDVYAQVEMIESAKPLAPYIGTPDEVERAPWFYLPDLLELLVQEKAAWEAGAAGWLERIILTRTGLDMLKRADPWDGLPAHVVFLDATGSGEIYRQLFSRNVEVYAPLVDRQGKVFQIVHRLNGIGTFLENILQSKPARKRLTKQGLEALELCREIISHFGWEAPGCVTYKEGVPEFEQVFGAGRVLHFHGQRGSNDLIECDGGMVIGAPQPKDIDLMRAVTTLYPRRNRPFTLVEHTLEGKQIHNPARSEAPRDYQYFDERGQAYRMISGFWNDTDLNLLADMLREQEIVQSVHRFRPITRSIVVVLLTSIPTTEVLTGIFDDPADFFGVPDGIGNWQAWLKLTAWLKVAHAQGQIITYQSLAEAVGIPATTVRRWKWLDIILRTFPDLWQVERLAPVGKGQPQRALAPAGQGITRALL